MYLLFQLKSGIAELFGTDLVIGRQYEFHHGANVAIFTCDGCVLAVKGKPAVSYVSEKSQTIKYFNCHTFLEQLRTNAEEKSDRGPIVMVVGPQDVGKSTLCRILLNYAVRMGRRPIYVDIDVGQGSISCPGTLGAFQVEQPATIEEGFSQQASIVYNFGYASPAYDFNLYKSLVSKLANVCLERLETNEKVKSSGIIINTCGWVWGDGYSHIIHAAQEFKVNTILVLDEEKLFNELLQDTPEFVKLVNLPKSCGVSSPKKVRSLHCF